MCFALCIIINQKSNSTFFCNKTKWGEKTYSCSVTTFKTHGELDFMSIEIRTQVCSCADWNIHINLNWFVWFAVKSCSLEITGLLSVSCHQVAVEFSVISHDLHQQWSYNYRCLNVLISSADAPEVTTNRLFGEIVLSVVWNHFNYLLKLKTSVRYMVYCNNNTITTKWKIRKHTIFSQHPYIDRNHVKNI